MWMQWGKWKIGGCKVWCWCSNRLKKRREIRRPKVCREKLQSSDRTLLQPFFEENYRKKLTYPDIQY